MITLYKIEVPKKQKLSDSIAFAVTLDNKNLLPEDLEFSVIYTGSPDTYKYDQCICTELVGPVPAGRVGFNLECDGVDIFKIPKRYLFGVTSIVIIGKYREQEFLRVGYFVKITYPEIELQELVYDDGEVIDGEETENDEDELEDDYGDEELDLENSIIEDGEEDAEDEEGEEDVEDEEGEDDAEEGEGDAEVDQEGEGDAEDDQGEDDEEYISAGEEGVVEDDMIGDQCKEELSNKKDIEDEKQEKEAEILNKEILQNIKKTNEMDIETIEKEDINEINELIIKDGLNYITVKNHTLECENIHIEFCEPPIITAFNIKWNNEEECDIIEEEIENEEEMKNSDEKPVKKAKTE